MLLKLRNKLGHLRDVLGGADQFGLLDIKHGCIFEEGLLVLGGVLLDVHAIPRRVADDFVIHVGNVHGEADRVPALLQKALQQIDGDECPEVADVAVVVDRGPTGIHANFVRLDRAKLLHPGRHGVKEAQGHSLGERQEELFILGVRQKRGQ